MNNLDKFIYVVDKIKSSNGYISVDDILISGYEKDDILALDFIEKLVKNDLVSQSSQHKWSVRKKQKLLETSIKDINKVAKGKSLEKPKWMTFDFYMTEIVKYIIGFGLGALSTEGFRKLYHLLFQDK